MSQRVSRALKRAALILSLWTAAYLSFRPLAPWADCEGTGAKAGDALARTAGFFFYESGRLMLLLVLIMLVMGLLRTFLTARRMRALLTGRGERAGVVLAALFGVATPFCTCSAVPLFIGFVTAGLPAAVAFSFLVSAPMVNEVALVLLVGLCGWKVALSYAVTGITVAIAAGTLIGRSSLAAQLEDRILDTARKLALMPEAEGIAADLEGPPPDWPGRLEAAESSTCSITGWTWPFILAGVAVGAGIHGFVPADSLVRLLGGNAWWSVPAAVLIGVPLYSTAAGMIPIVQALLGKGVALGTCLAFMMAVTGLSLPESIILRRALKPRLLAAFLGTVAAGITAVGYLFNLLF